jgi:anti-sigma factor RsiW
MKCLEREKMFAYVHRLLAPREEAEVRAHLAGCAACQAASREYEKLDSLLDEWKTVQPSVSFDARVRSAIENSLAEPRAGFFDFLGFRWLAPAFVAVLVAVASALVIQVRHSRMGNPSTGRQASPSNSRPVTVLVESPATAESAGEEELNLYQNLSVLENYDLLADFDVLSELPKGEEKVGN